jgi:hypothetical protein
MHTANSQATLPISYSTPGSNRGKFYSRNFIHLSTCLNRRWQALISKAQGFGSQAM